MPLSTEVIVRKEKVDFPPRCIVCDRSVGDGQEVTLRGNPVGLFGLIPWLFGSTRKLSVPAHKQCGAKLARAILMRNLLFLIGATAVAIIAVMLGFTKWQSIAFITAIIAIPALWQVLRPLAFEFTHHSDHFKLMFRNVPYASDVAALNNGELDLEDSDADGDDKEPPAGANREKQIPHS